MYASALRAAATAFKGLERIRQLHSGSLRLDKRKREIGEQVDLTGLKRPEKVLAPKAMVLVVFKGFIPDVILSCCRVFS